jgi:hypothetical protein
MKRATAIALASFLSLAAVSGTALAQSAKSLAGAWTLVSVGDTYGKNPKGALFFDGNGRYSLTITRSDLAKFASNSRVQGSADENKAVVGGSIAHFGRYKVDEKAKTLIFDIESSTFPNWSGTSQTRPFTVVKDELKYQVAVPSAGKSAGANEVVWKRAK